MNRKRVGTQGAMLLFLVGIVSGPNISSDLHGQERLGDVAAGELIYQQRCKRCHGVSGWGDGPQAKELKVPPRSFRDPMLAMRTDEQLLTSIEFGIPQSPMHGFRDSLNQQAMRDVLAYVRLLGEHAQ